MPGLTLTSRIFSKVGRKIATETATKTVTKSTLLKSIAGTAAGTYIITAVTKAGSINSAIAETLGIPDWLSAVLIAAVIAVIIIWMVSKISDILSERRAYKLRRMEYLERIRSSGQPPIDRNQCDGNDRGERRW